jgi:putative solute:sodium symporter small subunit
VTHTQDDKEVAPMATTTVPPSPRPGPTGELTERQKQDYWRYNVRLTTLLLAIWFVTTFIISGLMAGWLNQFTILGFPFGYYMAAQGSLAIFVIEIAVYAKLMNAKDVEYGIREEG